MNNLQFSSFGISLLFHSHSLSFPLAACRAQVVIGGSCSEFSKPLVDSTQWAGAGSNVTVIGYRSFDPALAVSATYPNFIRGGLVPSEEALSVYRLLAHHNLSSVGVLCSGAARFLVVVFGTGTYS
jgi:hypothetical protein